MFHPAFGQLWLAAMVTIRAFPHSVYFCYPYLASMDNKTVNSLTVTSYLTTLYICSLLYIYCTLHVPYCCVLCCVVLLYQSAFYSLLHVAGSAVVQHVVLLLANQIIRKVQVASELCLLLTYI